MALYLEERQLKTWAYSRSYSLEENLAAALLRMASYRQAAMDEDTVEMYLMELLSETDQRAIQVALANLARTDRAEGETAIPTVGRILAVAETAREFSGRRDSRYDYFPPDIEPVYAPDEGFPPPRLAGERLLRAILSEIRDIERSLGPGGIELTPESTRQRYEHLCATLRDPVGYDRKLLAGGVL